MELPGTRVKNTENVGSFRVRAATRQEMGLAVVPHCSVEGHNTVRCGVCYLSRSTRRLSEERGCTSFVLKFSMREISTSGDRVGRKRSLAC